MTDAARIPGTPGEVYQREMVPAIFARWAPDLIERARVRPRSACWTSPAVPGW